MCVGEGPSNAQTITYTEAQLPDNQGVLLYEGDISNHYISKGS